MDLTAISSVTSVLGILAPICMLLGFIWVWMRTESRHVLMYRIWRLLHGSQPINDPEVSAYIDEQTSLMSFRFLTGVQVKTLVSARELIQWAKFYQVEIQAISWCGDYFDPDLRVVRVQKLPSAWMQKLKIGFSMLVLLIAVIASSGIAMSDAALKFKATDQWFFLNSEKAKVLWPFDAKPINKSDCQAKAAANYPHTGFAVSEVQVLCQLLTSPEGQSYVQKAVTTQRWAFAFLVVILLSLTWILFWECMKCVVAKRLAERNLNPDVTGGQHDLDFNEN